MINLTGCWEGSITSFFIIITLYLALHVRSESLPPIVIITAVGLLVPVIIGVAGASILIMVCFIRRVKRRKMPNKEGPSCLHRR